MKLTIRYYQKLPKRKWILIREGGAYDKNAHFSILGYWDFAKVPLLYIALHEEVEEY